MGAIENGEVLNEIAIFWDYENVKVIAKGLNVPLAEAIIQFAASKSHPHVKRVYEDWSRINKTIIQALYSLGFETIQVSMGKTNSVDVKIAVDCLDTAILHPSVKYFMIITGDKDFIPVVNWLKAHHKYVIIISNPENVSEHLIMSANEFYSLEELGKKYNEDYLEESEDIEVELLKFDVAIKILVETVNNLREQGKSTRFGVVDQYMRGSKDYNYNGAKYIMNPDNSRTFKSFSEFILAIEKLGSLKTETIEGFKEIFLIDENPQEESEFSEIVSEKVGEQHMRRILELMMNCIKKAEEKSETVYKAKLFKELSKLRKKGDLPYFNRILRNILNLLIEINFISVKPNGSIGLAKDYNTNFENYLKNVLIKQI